MCDLNRELILNELNKDIKMADVCYEDIIGSTNELAKNEAINGAKAWTLFFAEHQTNGKGRFKRKWVSPKGSGIWATILLRPDMEVAYSTGYSILCGVAIARAIRTVTGLKAEIKWPNDIVIGGKKVCGILAEMGNKGYYIDWIIVGFGINVNIKKQEMDETIAHKATSLAIEKGKTIKRLKVLTEVIKEFNHLCDTYEKSKSLSFIIDEYKLLSCIINKDVELIEGESSKQGRVIGFGDDGSLLLKVGDNIEKINYGEVSVRGKGIYK